MAKQPAKKTGTMTASQMRSKIKEMEAELQEYKDKEVATTELLSSQGKTIAASKKAVSEAKTNLSRVNKELEKVKKEKEDNSKLFSKLAKEKEDLKGKYDRLSSKYHVSSENFNELNRLYKASKEEVMTLTDKLFKVNDSHLYFKGTVETMSFRQRWGFLWSGDLSNNL